MMVSIMARDIGDGEHHGGDIGETDRHGRDMFWNRKAEFMAAKKQRGWDRERPSSHGFASR